MTPPYTPKRTAITTVFTTATQTLYLVEDVDLSQEEAIARAREYYYYDDAYHLTAELANAYYFNGTIHSGWLVTVHH